MAETHDTIDGLLAEFREHSAGIPPGYFVTMSCHDFRRMLNRFDAAHKRERGNSAALREALKAAELGLFRWLSGSISRDEHRELVATIKTALAAPPRNCDIYLTEEAVDAATVTVRNCEACSRIDMEAPCVFCMVRWLLAPAQEKEGGANG